MGEVGKSPHVQSRAQALAIAYSKQRQGHWRGGPVYYAGGGIVEHDLDPELPSRQEDARLVPMITYPPAYLETIERLLANQRRRLQAPQGYLDYPIPLRRFWWGGWV
jgi:hypothetical protein